MIAVAEQTVWLAGAELTVGIGSTVTFTVVVDEHPLAAAVIVNIVVCGVLVVLVKVPVILDPVPLAEIPVRFVVLSLVQEKIVPGTLFGLLFVI